MTDTFRVDWYLDPATAPVSTTVGDGDRQQAGLNAGETVTLTMPVAIALPGPHIFYAQADTALGGAERDEANNITGPVTVLDGGQVYARSLGLFLRSWGVMGNLAITRG